MGHVVRGVNIASELKDLGVEVVFFVNDDPAVSQRLRYAGMDFRVAPLEDCMGHIQDCSQTVVFDAKKDISRIAMELKKSGRRVVAVDNLTDTASPDALVVPSVNFRPMEKARNLCYGPAYLVIGRGFTGLRATGQRLGYSLPLRVLVTMGGADPFGLTGKVVSALKDMEGIELTVVLGPATPSYKEVEAIAGERMGRVKILRDVFDMAPYMISTHIAFSAIGTTVYELAFMGVPSILIANYREDEQDLKGFATLGVSLSLGYRERVSDREIWESVGFFKRHRAEWQRMSDAAYSITDGLGASRIAGIISEGLKEGGACNAGV
jgi:spore coat polysaccharide biosynthesis predicted glycosyltransferase SpsG